MTAPFDPTRRRQLLRGALLATGASAWSRLSLAASDPARGERRLVLVLLRGGLDGLAAVPAPGDPDFAAARGALAQFGAPVLPLSGPFALHPALVQMHAMHGRGELAVLHATGLAYRERSHFDAQQALESGGTRPHELVSGWLGRALAQPVRRALALNVSVPLVLRGPGPVDTWTPSTLAEPSADLVARLERWYAGDAALAPALARAKALHLDMADSGMSDGARGPRAAGARAGAFVALAQKAAEFLATPGGPQAAVLELGGWDSHANQANPNGALAQGLRQLDAGLDALRTGLAANGTWARTVVVVATEFGRQVAINGTLGTDHGSGGAAFVLGGAVRGGRVLGDWPGLAPKDRHEGRDLRSTTDLRALLKGVLSEHWQLPRRVLDEQVFPGSATIAPLHVLV